MNSKKLISYVFPGAIGKHGMGIRHLIEERTKKLVLTGFGYNKDIDFKKKEKLQKPYKRLSLNMALHLNTLISALRWEL